MTSQPGPVTRELLCLAMWCGLNADGSLMHGREVAPNLRLCRGCRDRLARLIGLLPQLYSELESALTNTTRYYSQRIRSSSTPGIPLNELAANARSQMHGVLAAWAELVAEGRRVTAPARTVAALAAFLVCHLDWLAAHEAAGDAAREIHELVQAGRRAARPDPARRIKLGGCVEPACSGMLFAQVRNGDRLLPAAIVCNADSSHSWPPSQWNVVRKRMKGTP